MGVEAVIEPPVAEESRAVAEYGLLTRVVGPLAALWSLAVSIPLLDLLGANPAFLVAHDLLGWRLVVFSLAIVALGPLALSALVAAVRALHTHAGRWTLTATTTLLLSMLVLMVVRGFDGFDGSVLLGFSVMVSLGLGHLLRRPLPGRFLQVLGVVGPAGALALFLAASPASALLNTGAQGGTAIGQPAPVFMLLLDEFPLSSLITSTGEIDTRRHPNMARLAETATWYPRARTVAQSTERAVPALLTGRLPDRGTALPVASEHPGSLFELLSTNEIVALEPVTRMCESRTCRAPGGKDTTAPTSVTAYDTAVVYLHRLLPADLTGGLPSIDEAWAGFGGATIEDRDEGEDAEGSDLEADHEARLETAVWGDSSVAAEEFIESIATASDQTFHFGHLMLPHAPWTHLPTGESFQRGRVSEPARNPDGTWTSNPWKLGHAIRRHLWQVGYTDRVVGQFVQAIQDRGLWDDALVVVVSDHGVTFTPGRSRRDFRSTETAADVMHVPMFVKLPGQEGGGTSTFPALTTDIVPTVVDVLDLRPAPDLPGVSLVDPPDDVGGDRGRLDGAPPTDIGDVAAAAARRLEPFRGSDGQLDLVGFGPFGMLVGTPLARLTVDDVAETRRRELQLDELQHLLSVDRSIGFVPALVNGTLGGDRSDVVAISIDGIVAGVAQPYRDDDGPWRLQTLLDPALLTDGEHDVEAHVVTGTETSPVLEPLRLAN